MTPESKKRLIWILLAMAMVVIVAVAAAGPLLRVYREYQARESVAEANTLLADNDLEEALEAAREAYVADPDSPDVVRTVAMVYNKLDPRQAEAFWRKCFELTDDNTDLGNWVSAAIKAGEFDSARLGLEKMKQRGLTGSAYHLYLGQVLLHDQDLNGALMEARQALTVDLPDERAHFFFVQLTQLSDDSALRQEGMDYLWGLARQRDRLGLHALRNLANSGLIDNDDRLELIRLLEAHPFATREDRLLCLQLGYEVSDVNAERNLARAKEFFDLDNPLDLIRLGRWLNRQGRYAQTLEVISADEAFSRKDFFLIRMDAMAQLGQWRQLEDQLRRSGAPLDEFLRQLFLARAYMETGSESSGKIAWDRAVLEASRDAQKLWYLVQYARQLNFDDEAAAALWKLTDYPAHRQRACEELVQLYQLEYDARGMQKVLRLMVNSYPDNLSALNDWAYVNLLLREQEPAALRAAQKVVLESRHPYLSHYVTLALAYYRMGDFQKAFETLEPLQVNWLTAPPKWRVVYAAILRARGDYAPARQLLQSVDPADLLPEEIALVQVEVAKP